YHSRYRSKAVDALIFLHPSEAKTSVRFRIRRLDTDTDSGKPCQTLIGTQGSREESKLRPPVAISVVRAEGKTGSGFAMPVDLLGQPLKPFPIFLRTCALTFVFDVAVQFAPGDSHCAAQQLVNYVQRNHARKHRV